VPQIQLDNPARGSTALLTSCVPPSTSSQLADGTNPDDGTGDTAFNGGRRLKQWAADANSMFSDLYSSVFYPATPITTATISAAALAAFTAGGGTVQLPAIDITLTGPLPVYAGVIYNGAGFIAPQGALPANGTTLIGDGTFDAFDYFGFAGGIATNTLDPVTNLPVLGDQSTPPNNNAAFNNGFVNGFGVCNMSLKGFATGLKLGALYSPGVINGTFINLCGWECSQWGIWLENCMHCYARNIYGSGNSLGQIWVCCSGASADQTGNSVFINTYSISYGNISQRGLVVSTRGNSQINDVDFYSINGGAGGRTTVTQAATMSAGAGINIGVVNSAQFVSGQPVVFSASVNGFTQHVTYFVVTSAANVITVSNYIGGTPIAANNNALVNVISYGFSPLEVFGDRNYNYGGVGAGTVFPCQFENLDLETQGSVANSMLTIQNVRDCRFSFDYINAGNTATVVQRQCNGVSWTSSVEISNQVYDIDNTFANPNISGWRSQLGPGSGTFINCGVGFSQFNQDFSDNRAMGSGGLVYLTGFYGPEIIVNKSTFATEFGNYPIAIRGTQLGTGITIATQSQITSNITYTGPGGGTLTLPNIPNVNAEGSIFAISNPSLGTLTVNSSSGQPIIGGGLSATSYVIPALTDAWFRSCNNAGSLYWAVR